MGLTAIAILAVAAAAPQVEVVTLQGQKRSGEFQSLDSETLKLKDASGNVTGVPVSEVMQAGFAKAAAPATKAPYRVTLVDGTVLACTQVTVDSRAETARIESPIFGKLKLPLPAVSHIRFAAPNPKYEKKWQELLGKYTRQDRLVVADKSLDFLPVVVDRVTEKDVFFALGGQTPSRERKLFFGIIFSRKKTPSKPLCNVQLAGGGELRAARVSGDATKLSVRLVSRVSVEVPLAQVARLDYGLGKIQYLSGLEPRSVEFEPFIPDKYKRSLFSYRKDKGFAGKLTIGKQVFERGLWIHSRTVLKYRIDGEYRRLRATMGISQVVAQKGLGNVYVTISGDGRKLFEGYVRGTDAARELDLDVSKVRDLEILVDYGENDDTADRLVLGDARLIK